MDDTRCKILLIEDDRLDQMAFERFLKDEKQRAIPVHLNFEDIGVDFDVRMSGCGYKQTSSRPKSTSAPPPTSDIPRPTLDFRV